ncbi:MAG: trehalose-phosphatase [Allopontixanthobacter sediminis]
MSVRLLDMGYTSHLLPPPSLAELTAARPVALFLDFDGTLIPIASGPDTIVVPPDLPDTLAALSKRLAGRLALISGRSLEDLAQYLGNPPIFRAGSHGGARCDPEGSSIGEPPEAIPPAAMTALEEFAAAENLAFEPKTHGAALHFRSRPELAARTHAFAGDQAKRHGLQVKKGKAVVELVRAGVGKDGAVRVFMAEPVFAGAMPVFIGDDVTDEDGFIAATEFGGFGIAVGERESSNAKYRLENVKDVYEWLKP